MGTHVYSRILLAAAMSTAAMSGQSCLAVRMIVIECAAAVQYQIRQVARSGPKLFTAVRLHDSPSKLSGLQRYRAL